MVRLHIESGKGSSTVARSPLLQVLVALLEVEVIVEVCDSYGGGRSGGLEVGDASGLDSVAVFVEPPLPAYAITSAACCKRSHDIDHHTRRGSHGWRYDRCYHRRQLYSRPQHHVWRSKRKSSANRPDFHPVPISPSGNSRQCGSDHHRSCSIADGTLLVQVQHDGHGG